LATIRLASDRSLLISFGEAVPALACRQAARLTRSLEGVRGILNLHPAYASVLVEFDPRVRSHAEIEALVRAECGVGAGHARPLAGETACPTKERLVEIPVRYGGECGPDLEDVARHAGLPPERVVELHASASYLVCFLGFSPGFPYLDGLPPELATPRLPSPRKRVPAGSVAIGGSQAGVYPMDSPGGWRIIGRTPLALFDAQASPPALLAMGDRVRFVPIPEEAR